MRKSRAWRPWLSSVAVAFVGVTVGTLGGASAATAAQHAIRTPPLRSVAATTPLTPLAGVVHVQDNGTVGAIPVGVDVVLSTRAGTLHAAPGGLAQFFVLVASNGRNGTTPGQPVTLTLQVPAGLTFVGIAQLNGIRTFGSRGHAPVGSTWVCRSFRETAKCEYGTRRAGGAVAPVSLPGQSTIAAIAKYRVAASFGVGRVALRTTLTAPGNRGRSTMSATTSTSVAPGPARPELLPLVERSGELRPGQAARDQLTFINVGSGPASAVRLANVLPRNLVGSWHASGAGWTCTGAANAAPACSYSRPLAAGALSSRLTLRYSVSAVGIAALKLKVGGPGATTAWTMAVDADGAGGLTSTAVPDRMLVFPPAGSDLQTKAGVSGDVDELLPGLTKSTVNVAVTNIGRASSGSQLVIGGALPSSLILLGATEQAPARVRTPWACTTAATTVSVGEQSFQCRPKGTVTIPAARTLHVGLEVAAVPTAKPAKAMLTVGAVSSNEAAGSTAGMASVPLFILPGNVGYPALTLLRATGSAQLRPALDGSPETLLPGEPFSERFDVRDAGGAAIVAGSRAELSQVFGTGVTIASVRTPAGWTCTRGGGPRPSLSCAVTFAAALPPAASLEGPSVTVTASRPTAGSGTSWPVSIHLVEAGAPKAYSLPVLVTVERATASLVPDFKTARVPTAGGTGTFSLSVANTGNAATAAPVRLGVHVPAGVRLERIDSSAWSCVTAPDRRSARCASGASLAAGKRLPPIGLSLTFAPGTANRNLTLNARATDGARPAPKSANAAIAVIPHPTLHAIASAPDKLVFDDKPLVSAKQPLTSTIVTLEGDGSGGSGIGLQYTWTQRCTTAVDARARGSHCAGVTPPVRWVGRNRPTVADVAFAAPTVSRLTTLVFDLTVTDGSATATTFVRLKVAPLAPASRGFDLNRPHPKPAPSSGPVSARRSLPKPAEHLKPVTPKPTRISSSSTDTTPTTTEATTTTEPVTTTEPATTGETTTATTAETSTGETTTEETTTGGTTTTTTTPIEPLAGTLFCKLLREAVKSGGSFSVELGGVSLRLAGLELSGKHCVAGTTVRFNGSSASIGFLKATGVDGSFGPNGIELSRGTIDGPSGWRVSSFAIHDLVIPLNGTSASGVSGTATGEGFGFIPLPSGWHGTTTLEFSSGSISVSASATGPPHDASPGSAPPTMRLSGNVSSAGAFALSVDAERIVQLQGHAVVVKGSVSRSSPESGISFELNGELPQPFDVVPGLSVKTLHVKIAPSESKLGLEGEGTIALTTPSGSLEVGVKLAYDDPSNWSLTVDGAGSASWEPVPGLRLSPSDVHGAIVAKRDAYELTLDVTPHEAWTPTSTVSVSNLELHLSNTCPDTGAPCPKQASVFLRLRGEATFTLPAVGTIAAGLAGVLALPSGEFSVAAKLPSSVSIGGGITIDNARVEIAHGLPVGDDEPTIESIDSGGLRLMVVGGATLPNVGTLPSVHASFSSAGWGVAMPIGDFSLPGASGDGSKLSDTVLGWSSFPTSLSVLDPTTGKRERLELPGGAFKVTGTFATPGWLRQALKLGGDIHGRATGSFNPSSGEYALRMDFTLPAGTYLYGDAGSAANVRLTKTYFEIERKAADFNLALGGSAALTVAKTASLPESSVDLGIALSFSSATQTVAGSFSLSSQAGWENAFGARDLTLHDLAVAFSVNLATLQPGVGFAARAVLPGNVRSALGMPTGVQTTLVANISLTNPCLGIQVDDPAKSGLNVLNLGSGALTAKQFVVEVAPNGCTVDKFHYDPGLSLNFNGAVAGLSLAVAAHVGFSPFAVDASIDIGELSIGGLDLDKTHVELAFASDKLKVGFAGGVHVLGASVQLAGGIEQSGLTTKVDFTGNLDNLALGPVAIKKVAVKAHVETGPKPTLDFAADGAIELLGSTVEASFRLALINGELNEAHANVKTKIFVGGSSGLLLDGTFKLDYAPSKPFAVEAAVSASVGSFALGDASVTVDPSSLALSANLKLGSVFTARLEGAVYYGAPAAGKTIRGPGGTNVPASAGDFLLSARDVSLDLGGFKANGTVELGRAQGTPWANLATTLQLLGTGTGNSISINGSFSGSGDFSFAGAGNLDLAGVTAKTTVMVAKTGARLTVHGDANLSVLGSQVAFGGDFAYDKGSPRFRLTGSGNLRLGSYSVASAAFALSNFPQDAGMSADVSIDAGSIAHVSGRLSIVGSLFYFGANANLDLKLLRANGNITLTNCVLSSPSNPNPFPQMYQYPSKGLGAFASFTPSPEYYAAVAKWWSEATPGKCVASLGGTRLTAAAGFSFGGFSFVVSAKVEPNGAFSATARSPSEGEWHGETPATYIVVVAFYADFNYAMELTVKNSSPYVDLYGKGSAAIYGKRWEGRWLDWSKLLGIGASIRTNPFEACAYVNIWGKDFGGCIGG